MNLIHIAGHLAADPETRFTQTGKKVTTLRVGTRTRHKNADDTIWFRVTIWDEQFSQLMPHLKKGSAVMICGEFRKPDIFNDREGKPQISLEITAKDIQFSPFGKPASSSDGKPAASAIPTAAPFGNFQETSSSPYSGGFSPAGTSQAAGYAPTQSGAGSTFDDEVPF